MPKDQSQSLFFSKPSQQENQEQKFHMIIADRATNPRGFPYPLLNMQALINSCVNINIPDSLCRLLLPNVNLINICEPKVNLWAFKGVSCKLGGLLPAQSPSEYLPARCGSTDCTSGVWHGKRVLPNLHKSGYISDNAKWKLLIFLVQNQQIQLWSPPSPVKDTWGVSRSTEHTHTFLCGC